MSEKRLVLEQLEGRILLAQPTAGEIQAEEYVESSLPKRYRDVYWPGNLRAADMMRVVRPTDVVRRDYDLELLRAIQQLGSEQKEGRKVWTL